jgi:hypothetical protein
MKEMFLYLKNALPPTLSFKVDLFDSISEKFKEIC